MENSGMYVPVVFIVVLAIAFHHLYLGATLRCLAGPCLKLRQAFAAAVELFLHGAAVPPKTSPKPKKEGL